MLTATVSQWGNSQAVRLDAGVLKQAGLRNGSRLSVSVEEDGSIVLRPLTGVIRASDLDGLFAGYAGAYRGEELPDGGPCGTEAM